MAPENSGPTVVSAGGLMGWIANGFILIGIWLVGNKHKDAFLFSIAGESIWTVHAYRLGMYDLAVICGLFCILAFRNWLKWRSDETKAA